MKICNLCNRMYADETNFCLNETPTVVRFDGIAKSQQHKQIARSVKNTMIGTSIFFLLAETYTASLTPLIVGIIVEVLLFSCAKIYTKLLKD